MPKMHRTAFARLMKTVNPVGTAKGYHFTGQLGRKFVAHSFEVSGGTARLTIPMYTVCDKGHFEGWAKARRTAAQRETVAGELMVVRAKLPPLPVVVTLTRFGPRCLDLGDNLSLALSAVRDETAKFYGIADNDPRIEFRYAQVAPSAYGVSIKVEATR